jgi:hypothetical protein
MSMKHLKQIRRQASAAEQIKHREKGGRHEREEVRKHQANGHKASKHSMKDEAPSL